MSKGRIEYIAEAVCGRCGEGEVLWHFRGISGGARAVAREQGWKLTWRDGWVCPACLHEPATP